MQYWKMALEPVSQGWSSSEIGDGERPSLHTIIARVILLGELDGSDAIGRIRAHHRLPRVWFVDSNMNLLALNARSSIHRGRIRDAAALALLALQRTHIMLQLGQAGLDELEKPRRPRSARARHTEVHWVETHALGTGVVVAIGGARYTHSTLRAWQLEHFGREPSHCGRERSATHPAEPREQPRTALSLSLGFAIAYRHSLPSTNLPSLPQICLDRVPPGESALTHPRLLAPAGAARDRNPAALLRPRPSRRSPGGPARVLVRPGVALVVREGDPDRACHGSAGCVLFFPRICGFPALM